MKTTELCSKHKPPNAANDKDFRLQYVCLHRNCQDRFRLCCMKCRNQQHRDHAIKLLTIGELVKELDRLKSQVVRRQPLTPEYYELENKMGLIREFRVNLYLQEAALTEISQKLVSIANDIEKYRNQLLPQIEKHLQDIRESPAAEVTNQILQRLCQYLEYSQAKMKVELSNDRHKSLEDSRNKLQQEAESHTGRMKEYLMKIIEVLLDKGDEQQRGPRKQPLALETGTFEELRKALQQELSNLGRELTDKLTLKATIEERLEGLGVERPLPRESELLSSPKRSNTKQPVTVNDMPLVRCQSRNREQSDDKRYISPLKNRVREDTLKDSDLIHQKNEEIENLKCTIEKSQIALGRYCEQIEAIRSRFVKEIEQLHHDLQCESAEKQRLAQDLFKHKQMLEGRQQMEQNLKEISEHYNELIYEYNAIKDQQHHTETSAAEIEQLKTANSTFQIESNKLKEELQRTVSLQSGFEKDREDMQKQLLNLRQANDTLTRENKLLREKSSKEKAEVTKKYETEFTESKKLLEIEKTKRKQAQDSSLTVQEAKKRLESELKQLKAQCDKLRNESKQPKQELQRLRSEWKKLKDDEMLSKEDSKTLKQELERRVGQLERAKADMKKAKAESDAMKKQNGELKETMIHLEGECDSLRKAKVGSDTMLSELQTIHKTETAHFRTEIESLQSKYIETSVELESARLESGKNYQEIKMLHSELETLRNSLSSFQLKSSKEIEAQYEKGKLLSADVDSLRKQVYEKDTQITYLKKQLDQTSLNSSESVCRLLGSEQKNQTLLADLKAKKEETDRLHHEGDSLRKVNATLQENIAQLQALYRHAQQQSRAKRESLDFSSQQISQAQHELSLYKMEFDKLKAQMKCQLERHQKQKQQLNEEIEKQRALRCATVIELEKSAHTISQLKVVTKQTCESLAKLKEGNIQQEREKQMLNDKFQQTTYDVEQLKRSYENSMRTIEELRAFEVKMRNAHCQLQKQLEGFKKHEAELTGVLKCTQEDLRRANSERQNLQQHLNELAKTRAELEQKWRLECDKEASLEGSIRNMNVEYNRLKVSHEECEHILSLHKNELAVACAEYHQLERQVERRDLECNQLRDQLSAIHETINGLNEQLTYSEKLLLEEAKKSTETGKRMRYLEESNLSLESEIGCTRSELESKQSEVHALQRRLDQALKIRDMDAAKQRSERNALQQEYNSQQAALINDLEAMSRRIQQITAQKNDIEKAYHDLNKIRSNLEISLKNTTIEIQRLQQIGESQRQDNERASKKDLEQRQAMAKLEQLVRHSEVKEKGYREGVNCLEATNNQLKRQVETLRQTLANQEKSLVADVEQLTSQLHLAKQQIKTSNGQLAELQLEYSQSKKIHQQEIGRLNGVNLEFCKKFEEAEERRRELEELCNAHHHENGKLSGELSKVRSMHSKQTEQLSLIQATHKYLEEELGRRNNLYGMLEMEQQQLKSENERLLKVRLTEESNRRLVGSNDTILLTRELNNCKDQLGEERKRNSQLMRELDYVRSQLAENGKMQPNRVLNKECESYRAIRQIMMTLREDMQILESRIKDKDLIEKIYLKELESKKSQVSRLTAEIEFLRKPAEQNPYLAGQSQQQPSSILAKLEDAAVKLKNKENKLQDRLVSERICTFFESINKQ